MEKIKKILKENLSDAIQELSKDKLKIILELIISVIVLTASAYFKDALIELFTYRIPIWNVFIIFILFSGIFFVYNNYKSKSIHKFLKYGMEWHVKIKNRKVTSIEGPFCPPCQFEMAVSPFHCSKCDKIYIAPNTTNIEDARQTVKKIIEAELRSGKMLGIDWYTLNYPNSSFRVKNNGASTVKNISIQANLEINKEKKPINTYIIEKIDPDETIQIEGSDPMRDVHKILEELKLIVLNSMDIGPKEVEDDWGVPYLVPDFIFWLYLRNEFSCKLDVNISYSLRNIKQIEKSKYLLEFKFAKQTEPWGYRDYEDNCDINFHPVI